MIWTLANLQDLCLVHLHFGNIILGWVFSLGSSKQVVLHASNTIVGTFVCFWQAHRLKYGHLSWVQEFGLGKPSTHALYVQIQDSRQFVFALRTLPALHRIRMCVQTLLKSINAMSFLSPKRLRLKRLKKLFRN